MTPTRIFSNVSKGDNIYNVMAILKPSIQLGEEDYRIVCGEEEGDLVGYGETATLDTGDGQSLVAKVDFEEGGEEAPKSLLKGGVWMRDANTGESVECERTEVQFDTSASDLDGGDDTDDDEDDDEDDEEDEDEDLDEGVYIGPDDEEDEEDLDHNEAV